jgi:hypothetical protein
LTGDEKLVSSGDSEEYSKRDSGEENREFFQGAVTRQYEADQCISFHHFLLGGGPMFVLYSDTQSFDMINSLLDGR